MATCELSLEIVCIAAKPQQCSDELVLVPHSIAVTLRIRESAHSRYVLSTMSESADSLPSRHRKSSASIASQEYCYYQYILGANHSEVLL